VQKFQSLEHLFCAESFEWSVAGAGHVASPDTAQVEPDVDHDIFPDCQLGLDYLLQGLELAARVFASGFHSLVTLRADQVGFLNTVIVVVQTLDVIVLLSKAHLMQLGVFDVFQLENVVVGVVVLFVLPDSNLLVDVELEHFLRRLEFVYGIENVAVAIVAASDHHGLLLTVGEFSVHDFVEPLHVGLALGAFGELDGRDSQTFALQQRINVFVLVARLEVVVEQPLQPRRPHVDAHPPRLVLGSQRVLRLANDIDVIVEVQAVGGVFSDECVLRGGTLFHVLYV